jgi:8-oxo-dGTP pyrophosphatase MutT (NUDIX family)
MSGSSLSIHGVWNIGRLEIESQGNPCGNSEDELIRKALIVVVAKHLEDMRILVLKTTKERGGFWQCPTGKIEEGESPMAGALREAEEETGLRYPTPPQFLGLRYSFEGRWGPAEESAFGLWIFLTDSIWPKVQIDPKEHESYQWLPPEEAQSLVAYPMNKRAIALAAQQPPLLTLNQRGEFLQEGEEITHWRSVQLLHRSLEPANQGEWRVRVGQETLPVAVESTPYFITDFSSESGTITLSNGQTLPLALSSLDLEPDGALVARLQNFRARFLVGVHHRFAQLLEGGPIHYSIPWKGQTHSLQLPPKGKGMNS